MTKPRVGTAGWSIPRQVADRFPPEGAGLERYAARFGAVEINSSFHRPHRPSTWRRWAESVPDDFRFSAKLPKTVTHVSKLVRCEEELDRFFGEAGELGAKLGVVLVQLPPKLGFGAAVAEDFFAALRERWPGSVACEPRHPDWFTKDADELMARVTVARVAADPALCAAAAAPGGWRGLSYWRLHGSPVIYRSSYADRIEAFAAALRADEAPEKWCIFDNTASSAAASDALALAEAL